MKKRARLVYLTIALIALAACQPPTSLITDSLSNSGRGAIKVSITASRARTVVPNWNTVISSYQVTLTSHDGYASQSNTISSGSTTSFSVVNAGTWDVSVVALNGSITVGIGSLTNQVLTSEVTLALTISVSGTQTGVGNFSFSFAFPSSISVNYISGQLFNATTGAVIGSGFVPPLSLNGSTLQGNISQSGIASGNYRLGLTFKRGGASGTIAGFFSEAVNVWDNVTSDQWLDSSGNLNGRRSFSASDFNSSNTNLSNLVVSDSGTALTLSPGFSSNVTTYTTISSSAVTITPTVSVAGQAIQYQLNSTTGTWTTIGSGGTSSALTLGTTSTAIYIKVTANDQATTAIYQVAVATATPNAPWARRYSGTPWNSAYIGIPTSDGGFAIGGASTGYPSGSAHLGAAIIKFRADQSIEWQYGYHSNKDSDYLYGLVQTTDGGFICSGRTAAGSDAISGLLMKVDSTGTMVWKKYIDGLNEDYFFQVVALSDGSFVACGRTNSLIPTTVDCASWLVRFAENGTILWQRAYTDTTFDYASAVTETSDGKIMIAGLRSSTGVGSQNDTMVMKIDIDGAPLWRKTYDEGGRDNASMGLIKTSDGSYLVEGFTSGGTAFWIMKIDSAGNQIWAKSITGGQNNWYDNLFIPCESSDGGYIIPGYTTSFGAGSRDVSLLKLTSTGIVDWAMTYGGALGEAAVSVAPFGADGYLIAGETDSASTADFLVMKIGLDGSCGSYGVSRVASSIDAPATVTTRSAVDGVDGFHAYVPTFVSADAALTRIDLGSSMAQIVP